MAEAMQLVTRLLGRLLTAWDKQAYDSLWHSFCKGLWYCRGFNHFFIPKCGITNIGGEVCRKEVEGERGG